MKDGVDVLAGGGDPVGIADVGGNLFDPQFAEAGIVSPTEDPHMVSPLDKLFDEGEAEEAAPSGDKGIHADILARRRAGGKSRGGTSRWVTSGGAGDILPTSQGQGDFSCFGAAQVSMSIPKIEPGKTRVGWIGTGVMGSSMVGHLMTAGFAATVYNRNRSKAEALVGRGARWADSPAEVARNSDVIFTIVGFPRDVREVMLGGQGALAGAAPGSVLVDMTTSEPSLAVAIYDAAKAKGVHSVDAPVSGGDIGAREARLSIMLGGDKAVVEALNPLWNAMGKTIVHQGGPGAGQHTKMVNQILIASGMIGVCEALLYGYKAGLDLPTVLQSVGSGAAGSWSLSNLGPRIMNNNFDPGFFVEHFIKDMGIALEESRRMGLCLPGLALANQLYLAVQAQGMGRNGTHALHLALAKLAGVDWKNRV